MAGMDDDQRYTIGELARRTGLTVKAIRFYADRGIVPPTERGPTGHRRYDQAALARLELVRTLRQLDLDLTTIRRILDRELPLPEVAAAHAEALATQIRTLRLRQVVLAAVAKQGISPEEMDRMHRLAKFSDDERGRVVQEFVDTVFGGVAADPAFAGISRSLTPELPDDPTAQQVEAWLELVELSQDPDFRDRLRRVAEQFAADRAQAGRTGPARDPVSMVRDQAGPALAAGVDPGSSAAQAVVATVAAGYAHACGLPDDGQLRRRLLDRVVAANDRRRERYGRLLSVVNGWSAPEDLGPLLDWFTTALRSSLVDSG